MLDPSAHRIERRLSPRRTAILSIDVEHDYNGSGTQALERLPDLLAAVQRAGLPLTAFVEGRLFGLRPDLCARLVEAAVDVQLHCHDHRAPGDTAEGLERGIEAFRSFTGARPKGYRANTFRLSEALFAAVLSAGFAWDSSILPGLGLGNHRSRVFRHGDYFLIDDAITEFPVASWRGLGIPFTHAYRQLMGPLAERLLDRAAALPALLVYDMHMVDLVPDGRIGQSPLPLWLKGAQALARFRQRGFGDLAALGKRLEGRGYEWTTLSCCYEQLAAEQ